MPKGVVPGKLSVDFSNVGDRTEGGGRAAHIPEGDCLLQPVFAEIRKKKDDPTSRYISWKMAIVKPSQYKTKGFIYHVTTLKDEGLWSLRNLLEDMGVKVPKAKVDIPLAAIVKKSPIFGATVEDDEYNGKVKSKIAATFPAASYEDTGEEEEDDDDTDDTDEDEEEEEAPAPKKKATKKPAKATDEDDDDDDEEEEMEELDVDDL